MSAGARRGESKRVDGEEGASGRSRTGEGDGSEGSGATGERQRRFGSDGGTANGKGWCDREAGRRGTGRVLRPSEAAQRGDELYDAFLSQKRGQRQRVQGAAGWGRGGQGC